MTGDRSARGFRTLLRLAPERLRRRHGAEMEELFAEWMADARARGRGAVFRAWIAAIRDLLRAALAERRARPRSLPHDPTRKQALMLGTDLKYTFRWLSRQKLSTSLVLVMLTLAIAANVVVFSLVNGLFLRPFPFPDPDRLVYINETAPRWNLEIVGVNYPDFDRWRRDQKIFDAIALFDEDSFNVSDASGAERVRGATVTHDFATVLGISPILGRMFTAAEDKPGAARVVVIGEGLWKERFKGSDTALGQTLQLNGLPHEIVGVMPAIATFPGNVRLWVPFAGDPEQSYQSYGATGIGRLKAGASAADGERDLLRAHQPIWDARDKTKVVSPFARPLREQFVRDFRSQASALFLAVGILLVVACANVASVMLARALQRRREMGIRLAVGASRMRLARQLFVENVVLAACGGIAGLVLGRWALTLLIASAGDQVPPWAEFSTDFRVVGFAALMSMGTALLFGLAPALHAIRGNLRGAMQDTSAGTTGGPGGRRTLSLLVGAEFAMAAVLLVCGGLLWRAYDRVRHVDPGFRPDHVLTFGIALPDASYPEGPKQLAFWKTLGERLGAQPGVETAGLVTCVPLGCHTGTFFDIEGRAPLAPGEVNPVTLIRRADPAYFAAMGIRLKQGRFIEPGDTADKQGVAVVNEAFARAFWPGKTDIVGRRFRNNGPKEPWITVVGLAGDVRHYGLERPMRPGIYVPLAQAPVPTMTVAIRTAGDPAAFAATARGVIRDLDPTLPMYGIRTMETAIQRSMVQRALYSWMLAVFAGMALLLALGGTYGVTSYLVSQRKREIGIRIALGARTSDITAAVLRRSLGIVGTGVIVGIAASIGAARLLADLLFGVSPRDPAVLGAAAAALFACAALSNWLPARRAARVDPIGSLRAE